MKWMLWHEGIFSQALEKYSHSHLLTLREGKKNMNKLWQMERFMERDIAKDNENTDRFMIYCCQTMTVPWYTDVTLWQFHGLLVSHSEHSMIYCYRTLTFPWYTAAKLCSHWNINTETRRRFKNVSFSLTIHVKYGTEKLKEKDCIIVVCLPFWLCSTVWSSIISCYGNFGIWFSTFAVRL